MVVSGSSLTTLSLGVVPLTMSAAASYRLAVDDTLTVVSVVLDDWGPRARRKWPR